MESGLESILTRLTKPKRRRDEKQALTELRRDWEKYEDALIDKLRTSELDDAAAALGYRPDSPRVQVITALLQRPTEARVGRLRFLLSDKNPKIRARFAQALAAVGEHYVVEDVARALEDPDRHVRHYATFGLRDALSGQTGARFRREAVKMLMDTVRRHPKDTNAAIFQALEYVNPSLVGEADSIVKAAKSLDESQSHFVLKAAQSHWGDYGDVLINGISWNQPRDSKGRLQLERTGPFVPPITFPSATGDVVVTAQFRRKLEASRLRGLQFVPVSKRRIVLLKWEDWNQDEDPQKYPAGGEPENYVLKRKHRPELANAMPELFELAIPAMSAEADGRSKLEEASRDFVLATRGTWPVVVSRRAMEWLRRNAAEWISFENTD